jgi:hypothetical protein
MPELDDTGRSAADDLLARVAKVARDEATKEVNRRLANLAVGGRLNWEMLTQWGHHISDNGTAVPIRPNLDLVGFTVADVPAGDLTRVTASLATLGAMVWSDTNQNIPANTHTALTFQQVDWDTDTCWSVSTPTVLTCHTVGVYAVVGYAQLVASTPGTNFNLELIVEKNTPLVGGWMEIARNSVGLPPVDNPACSVTSPPRTFLVGDLVRLRLNHSSTVTEQTAVSTYSSGTKPVEPPQLAFWRVA